MIRKIIFLDILRKKLKEKSVFTSLQKKNENSALQLKKYSGIIFMAYQEEDIVAFIDLYLLRVPMIVCSENKVLITHYKKIPKITCIDISQNKNDIFKELELVIDLKLLL